MAEQVPDWAKADATEVPDWAKAEAPKVNMDDSLASRRRVVASSKKSRQKLKR